MKTLKFGWLAGVAMLVWGASAVPVVSNVRMKQIVGTKTMEITYDLADSDNTALHVDLAVSTNGVALPVVTVNGDVADNVTVGTGKKIIWDAGRDWGGRYTEIAKAHVSATRMSNWCIVDLSGGPDADSYPVEFVSTPPADGWSKEKGWTNYVYKTTKLVLREIPAGTFKMGSPNNEYGRSNTSFVETQHQVTLTKPYYIGVFEVTQGQYKLVTGENPSQYNSSTTYPVSGVTYEMIRGPGDGVRWPSSDVVDSTSFLGKLRAKTGLLFDLPTEAQWEYACRAGTKTALNNGTNLSSDDAPNDANLSKLGWYYDNCNSSGRNYYYYVGEKEPNEWGLYDMHGNVAEWCADCYYIYNDSPATDPKGHSSRDSRVLRGGSYSSQPKSCRSASRSSNEPRTVSQTYGFRLELSAGF